MQHSLKIFILGLNCCSLHLIRFLLYHCLNIFAFSSTVACYNKLVYTAEFATEQHGMSVDVIRKAFTAIEEGFISLVRKQWFSKPQIASVGSCCLVGVICGGILYVANVGDSRAVLGRVERGIREVSAVQISEEHNVSIESVREEVRSLHPDDPHIVVLKHKVWRVKGLIQVIHLPR